jgi:hypothetical protein
MRTLSMEIKDFIISTMKKIVLLCLFGIFVTVTYGQKNLKPVTQSTLTGIELPVGSKQDSRILSVAAAATLLEMESDKVNSKVQNTEVLVLPPASLTKFSKDSLIKRLSSRTWKIIVTESDKFVWFQKDKRFVIAYFSTNTKQTDLYLAEAASIPNFATGENNETVNPVTLPAVPAIVNPTNQPIQPANQPIQQQTKVEETKIVQSAVTTSDGKFAFTSTNFDDGWVSAVREDWVEVTKNNVKVLIHYPNATTSKYISDSNEELQIAWNTLVAPRYSNLQNYFVAKNSVSYFQSSFVSGTLTDKQTGQTVYVALFKRDHGAWLEFIAPTINTFGQVIGFDINKLNDYVSSSDWDPLLKLEYYNRFAVAASDLTGIWTNNFGGYTQYVNAYTGADAGMNTHSSTQTFEFLADGSYNWSIGVASGFVGNIKFSSAKSSGKFTNPNNWQIHFSELEGKPRLYNAYFSCVKGARILWLQDTGYGDYSSYGRRE